jgi:hypothetical protein
MTKRHRTVRDSKLARDLLPFITAARAAGARRLNDLLAAVADGLKKSAGNQKPLTRSSLNRSIVRLKEMGLDPGLDDRSTARKLGRPTRGKSVAEETGSIQAGETGKSMSSG